MRITSRPLALPVAVLAPLVAFGLTACGSSSGSSASSASADASAPVGTTDCTKPNDAVAKDVTVGGVTVTGKLGEAPKITVAADSKPATELIIKDIAVGNCRTVQKNAWVVANYTGVGQASKKQFDSSWDRGEPIGFSLNGVIPGWGEGVPGMKEGGRRLLIIPGSKAYGANPPSADIKADETLIFVIDMVATPPEFVKP